MSEVLIIPTDSNKKTRYEAILPQINALVKEEKDLIANLANIAAALKYGMNFFWVGFYIVKNDELVLGPFQGPIACTRIAKGKGVCGAAWDQAKTIIVHNVDEFPGHIACSSESKSEIVVPFFTEGKVSMVLDIDSDELNSFDVVDQQFLEQMREWI